jgi:maleylacetate reductase
MKFSSFVWDQPAVRVVFGTGSVDRLGEELSRLGAVRPVIVATPEQRDGAADLAKRIGPGALLHAEAAMHVPIEVARAGRDAARRHGADAIVAFGGGSAIGLAKAIAMERPVPIVAIPTTYSGSEMTPIYGLTEGGLKKTGRDPHVQAKTVLYDPMLTLTLPPRISGPSGMNAMAHCVEALYAKDATPISTIQAVEGIRALSRALPVVVREPSNLEARTEALYGSWLGGSTLAATSMGIHHKLCHTLGGAFNLPHAEMHTVILPHAAAFNRDAAAEAMRLAAEALGASTDARNDAPGALFDLAASIGGPTALKDIGMPADGLDQAAKLALESAYYNPRPLDYDGVRQLLENAYRGTRP